MAHISTHAPHCVDSVLYHSQLRQVLEGGIGPAAMVTGYRLDTNHFLRLYTHANHQVFNLAYVHTYIHS